MTISLGVVNNHKTIYWSGSIDSPAVKAWLTFKADLDDADPGLLQKTVTTTDVPGTGQITDAGAGGVAEVRFDLSPANTIAIGYDVKRHVDVRLLCDDGTVVTGYGPTLVSLRQGVGTTNS